MPFAAAAERLLTDGVRRRAGDDGRDGHDDRHAGGAATVPVDAVPVVDTIGAGDAFTAGFVTWWHGSGPGS